jgi:ABC-type spermidine/putrescine transport system permease subunit II
VNDSTVDDPEREVRTLQRKWLGIKLLIGLSAAIFLLPVGVWIVQSFQNHAGIGVSGGTLVKNSGAVIHHNGALADAVTLFLTVAVMAGLVVFYYQVFDRLRDR